MESAEIYYIEGRMSTGMGFDGSSIDCMAIKHAI